ncbi:MAG: choice-of-anchor H family protein [Phycisphaerae bacterium]|nr:choice-of-anchor H family protein [Phycisphaerae bacterium]
MTASVTFSKARFLAAGIAILGFGLGIGTAFSQRLAPDREVQPVPQLSSDGGLPANERSDEAKDTTQERGASIVCIPTDLGGGRLPADRILRADKGASQGQLLGRAVIPTDAGGGQLGAGELPATERSQKGPGRGRLLGEVVVPAHLGGGQLPADQTPPIEKDIIERAFPAEALAPADLGGGPLPADQIPPIEKDIIERAFPAEILAPTSLGGGSLPADQIPVIEKARLRGGADQLGGHAVPDGEARLGFEQAERMRDRICRGLERPVFASRAASVPEEKFVTAEVVAETAEQVQFARNAGIAAMTEEGRPIVVEMPADLVGVLRRAGLGVDVLDRFLQVEISPGEAQEESSGGEGEDVGGRGEGEGPRGSCTEYAYGDNNTDKDIPDDPDECNGGGSGYTFSSVSISGYSGHTVCKVEYRVRIVHTWPGDIYAQINNSQHSAYEGDTIWNRLGGTDDGGYDDDAEDDEDIYLVWRESHFFDGDNVDNTWYLDVWDECPGDTGNIDYVNFRIYYEEDTATIFSAWWSNEVDEDVDGYVRSARLNWDPDVDDCDGSLTVYEMVYWKLASSGTWNLLTTTSAHVITDCSGGDAQYQDILGGSHNLYDWKIEVYRSGQGSPDYTRDPSNDSDLNDYPMETDSEDTPILATIFSAWWSNEVDEDGDGYVRSARLNWDPDVAGCSGSLTVYEMVYWKLASSGTWNLITTTSPHDITDCSGGDAQYRDYLGGGHSLYDWKIEIYRSGQGSPDYSRDPSNDSDLNDYPMETDSEDTPVLATICSAWWSNEVDEDGDGYVRSARLNWDPDVAGCSGSLLVYEMIYWKLASSGTWNWINTTTEHTITDCSVGDIQYQDYLGGSHDLFDWKIEIYRSGQGSPDYTRDADNDSDLNDYPMETASEDTPILATVASAWWSNEVDEDGDGYVCSARLNWDPDVAGCSGSLLVYEMIYWKLASSGTWNWISTTSEHTITDCSVGDIQYRDYGGGSHNLYDWKIEIYRSGQGSPDATRGPDEDSDLNDYPMETASEDEVAQLEATVYDALWSNEVDEDGDGYVRSARLTWDPDVVGCDGSLTVYEMIYWKLASSGTWNLITTTSAHVITDCSAGDTQYRDYGGGGHSLYDWRIEVYRSGEGSPDYTRDADNDSDLNDYAMETAAEDEVETTGFGGRVSACDGGAGLGGALVEWGSHSTTTNGYGDYSFTDVPCETNTLMVSKTGYLTHTESYTPDCGTWNVKDVCLQTTGVDLAVHSYDITLITVAPNVEATIIVHNLGNEDANNVTVKLLKRTSPYSFVLAGTDMISTISAGSQGSTMIVFTPDYTGQEIKVVVSLPDPYDDINLSNNEAIVVWTDDGAAPVVVELLAQYDGNHLPNMAGRYIAGIETNNTFYATVQPVSAGITSVSFQIDGGAPVGGVQGGDGRWTATFDMGELAGGQTHTLTVVATDAASHDSQPKQIGIEVLELPSWAEGWNSSFDGYHSSYALAGFIPVEWRLDQVMPAEWFVIGGMDNRFRAGLYTTAEIGLDKQIFARSVAPAVYILVLGESVVDFKVDGQFVPAKEVRLGDYFNPGSSYLDDVNVQYSAGVIPIFDTNTLELANLGLNVTTSFEHETTEVDLTPTPIFFTVMGWPMSFEADLAFTPAILLCVTVSADGDGFFFTPPTHVQPSLNVKLCGTVNVIEAGVVAVGASLQPNVDFAYDIAYIPPEWVPDWLIHFALDLCLRLRLGWGWFSKDFDLGCVTLFEHDWADKGRSGGRLPILDPPVDPAGVLNRPQLLVNPVGIRVLAYAGDDPDGDPSELYALIDPATGTWQTQGAITDDLYPDLDPTAAYTYNSDAVVVWTKVQTLADDVETSTIDELISTQDLYWSKRKGSSWTSLGSGTGATVNALTVADTGSGPALYAGGYFTAAGGAGANHIAEWKDGSWAPLDTGTNCAVLALTGFDDGMGSALYAGGCFSTAGGTAVDNVARWDGSAWSPLGDGVNGSVWTLFATQQASAVGPALYAGGQFTEAGGVGASYVARWEGGTWSPLGSGMNSLVLAMAEFDDGTGGGPALYAGGYFTAAGGTGANYVAQWDGSAWSPPGTGMNSYVLTLTVFDDQTGGGPALYAGGAFTNAGGAGANFIARWDGSAWSPLGSGMNDWVYALTVFDDGSGPALYAAGLFTSAGGQAVNRIAKWDGESWSSVGDGVNSFALSLSVFDDGTGDGPALYAGGDFTEAGGLAANRVARWKEASWSTPASITDDNAADGLAKLAFSDSSANGLVLWCRDEASDFADMTGDEIAYATWTGSGWSPPAMLTNDASADRNVAVCYLPGTADAVAVWTKETEPVDHLMTLHFAQWDGAAWSTPTAVPTHTAERASQVNIGPLSDGRALAAWAVQTDDGWSIKTALFDPTVGWDAVQTLQTQLTLADGLQLQIADNDVVYVFWHGYELDDDLFGLSKDFADPGASWVGPSKLTGASDIEWQPTGVVDADNELSLVYARVPIGKDSRRGPDRNGLPEALGSSAVPGNGNWHVANTDLTLVGDAWVGESVTVQADLHNTGTTDTMQTTARFWLGDPLDPESTPIGGAIQVAPVPPSAMTTIESQAIALDAAGHLDVYLVVAAPVAEADSTDNQAVLGVDVTNNDSVPPQVSGIQVIPLRDEGRLGAELVVTFDEAVMPPTIEDIVLIGDTSGLSVADQAWTEAGGMIMHTVFEDRLTAEQYTLTLKAEITDKAGNTLDGNGDGTGGDDYETRISLVCGDIDNDGDVDFDDLDAFVAALLGLPIQPEHVFRADMNGDGFANGADVQLFVNALIG